MIFTCSKNAPISLTPFSPESPAHHKQFKIQYLLNFFPYILSYNTHAQNVTLNIHLAKLNNNKHDVNV